MVKLFDLAVNRIPGIKGEDAKKIVSLYKCTEDLIKIKKADIEQLSGHTIKHDFDMEKIIASAQKDEKNASLRGINTVSLWEDSYPPLLKEIYDPPLLLFYRGTFPKTDRLLIAMVGTRKPSSSASAQAFVLGRELGKLGISAVSGLASGIDALSHKGNIEGGGSTVAVLGSGPDMIYPVSNRALARRILETGGCIISEYVPGEKPAKWHFPARNRIISGLCRGTVIVEAPLKSGALITANFALEQNRELMAASAGIASRIGEGTAKLAGEGAAVVSSGKEILDRINSTI